MAAAAAAAAAASSATSASTTSSSTVKGAAAAPQPHLDLDSDAIWGGPACRDPGVLEGAAGEVLGEARKALAAGRWEDAAGLYGEALEADLRQRVAAGGGRGRGGPEEAAARTERSLALSQVEEAGWASFKTAPYVQLTPRLAEVDRPLVAPPPSGES